MNEQPKCPHCQSKKIRRLPTEVSILNKLGQEGMIYCLNCHEVYCKKADWDIIR